MRAEEYLNRNKLTIRHFDVVIAVIGDLSLIRKDKAATYRYYDGILMAKPGYGRDRPPHNIPEYDVESASWRGVAPAVRYELFKVTGGDRRFWHIFYLLACEQNRNNTGFVESPIECLNAPYSDNDMDFYYNSEVIKNQTLVFETVQYFEEGEGKGFFEPLDFLNLLWKQKTFILINMNRAQTVIDHLKRLRLDERRRHILLCFIIKWAGGYPVSNLDVQFRTTYSLIVKEFLNYPEDTPEKEFCRNNWQDNKAILGDLVSEDDWLRTQIEMLKEELNIRNSEIADLETANNQIDTTDTGDTKGTSRVQTVALLKILEKAGASKKNTDITKLTRLIAYLTGKNSKNTYDNARKGIAFTSYHHPEIDKVNELLDDINIGISIDKNNTY
jgi:hypothetical protein